MEARQRPVTQHSFLTAGGWLIPGTSSLCPPAAPHPQFGGPLSLPSTHGCERYPALRNHRPTPYPSPYAHRNNSPSKSCVEVGLGLGVDGRPSCRKASVGRTPEIRGRGRASSGTHTQARSSVAREGPLFQVRAVAAGSAPVRSSQGLVVPNALSDGWSFSTPELWVCL